MDGAEANPAGNDRSGRSLFRTTVVLCAIVSAWGIADPASLGRWAQAITSTTLGALDWFFMGSVTVFLVACIWLAIGPYGRLRLGADDERPEFSTASWIAMLFSAGMGSGLLFWGAAEPLTHFSSPPLPGEGPAEAARTALLITNFHWGLHAWAVYAIGALILAWFGFRRGQPSLAGSPIRSAFQGRWVAPVAAGADLIAVLSVAFGVAATVAMSTMQIHSGLHVVMGTEAISTTVDLVIVIVLMASYLLSATTSLDKGIRWLSNLNMILALLLLAFVLTAGPTSKLLGTFVTAVGDYASGFVGLSLDLHPFANIKGWVTGWTLTYFIWWISWAPFVGLFIARISRGRTVREFIGGVLVAPTVGTILWFSIFGGTALELEMEAGAGLAEVVRTDVTLALFSLFDALPFSSLLSVISAILLFVFAITSADSATYVLGMMTSGGSADPPRIRKLAWGLLLGAMGLALLLTGQVDTIRALAIFGAIPFTFVLLLQCAALVRVLRRDGAGPGGGGP